MKTLFRKIKKSWALMIAASVLLCGCSLDTGDLSYLLGKDNNKPEKTDSPLNTYPNYPENTNKAPETDPQKPSGTNQSTALLEGARGTLLSLNSDNSLNIQRLKIDSEAPSGDKDVWTVLVYLCGTDLESKRNSSGGGVQGAATLDLQEMINATDASPNLRFIVETGGTSEWNNNVCTGNKKQRFIISGGNIEELYSGTSANMGMQSTLQDFLSWALDNYSSEHMCLDFWNHGGGSITGVCFDELHNGDSLSLKEIDMALAAVFEKMTKRFDIIGCDACLMATVETANIFAPYAEYAVFSQNLESGYGWDYEAFSNGLKNGADNGGELGKYLCDGLYDSCKNTGEQEDATLSVIDLSKTNNLLEAFNDYAMELYQYCGDKGATEFIKAAKNALNFGGNNRINGYTNMVDMGQLTRNFVISSDKAQKVLDAVNDCVYYKKNGANYSDACGLSIYYPLCIQGSKEIEIFKDICISPFYLNTVDACAYSSNSNGSLLGYISDWLDSYFWDDSSISQDYNYWNGDDSSSLDFSTNDTALSYAAAPHIDNEGYYTFTLTKDSLDALDSIYCDVMMSYYDDDGTEYMLDLGTDDYVTFDWDTGECYDNFDGTWFALPDGQPLCAYLVEQEDIDDTHYANIYTCPIYLNDEYTNLKVKQLYKYNSLTQYYDTVSTEILGVWAGINQDGSAARDVYRLEKGDKIEPCYSAYNASTYEYADDFYGDAYYYSGDDSVIMDYLYDGDYYYSFEINDYYGNTIYTDFVLFGFENGELFYYTD